jgi:NADH:ubiquinone oxidoreductase subunit D
MKNQECKACGKRFRHQYLLIGHVRAELDKELRWKEEGLTETRAIRHIEEYHEIYMSVLEGRARMKMEAEAQAEAVAIAKTGE